MRMKNIIFVLILTYSSLGIYGQNDAVNNTNKTNEENNELMTNKQQDERECKCVPYYLCNDRKITNVAITIDGHFKDKGCESYLDVRCCNTREDPVEDPAREPITRPPETKNKCGYRIPDGVGFQTAEDKEKTEFGEFAWVVGVLEQKIENNSTINLYRCTGSLIHPQVIITAAHCVYNQTTKYKIRAGEWDVQTTNEPYPHQDRIVKNIITHKAFEPGPLHNDIAILVLETPFEIAENVDVLCLPKQDFTISEGASCYASGWGKNGKKGTYQSVLKKIQLPIVDRENCQEQLRNTSLGKGYVLDKSFVCAGGEKGIDTCKGDGGGPLMCPILGQENRYHQVGIVSWGIGCGEDKVPGVYADVGLFRNWIDEQMKEFNLDASTYVY